MAELDFIKGTDLISVVARAVREGIPESDLKYIYKDKPRQNFEYCSLYIDMLNLEQRKQMRRIYNRQVFLDLRLHPLRDQDNAQTWCRDLTERILEITAFLWFKGERIRCTTAETYYIENEQVQHIILVYPYRVLLYEPPDPDLFLQTLEEDITIEYGKE